MRFSCCGEIGLPDRGGNVTRRPKTSGFWLIGIYLRDGTRISRNRTLIGGFLPTPWRGLSERSREANSKREFGIRQFIREGGDGHVWGTNKNIRPHRHRSRTWPDAWRVRIQGDPRQAADLGGDCCADLEERVAELEATTVRKGNKKVSVTLSGWVVKSMNCLGRR